MQKKFACSFTKFSTLEISIETSVVNAGFEIANQVLAHLVGTIVHDDVVNIHGNNAISNLAAMYMDHLTEENAAVKMMKVTLALIINSICLF